MTTTTSFGSLADLRRVVRAMRVDSLRVSSAVTSDEERWQQAGERVVLVCGCAGSCGATTVALALATVAGRARVVETSGQAASGLAYAAGAELGAAGQGWLRGSRNDVLVERRGDDTRSPEQLPTPAHSDMPFTVVDSAWDIATLLRSPGWLGYLARTAESVVLVTRATVPGLRRLEASVAVVGEGRAITATVGARRWPRQVEQSLGSVIHRLRAAGRVVRVPEVPALAVSGLTPDPLPPALIRSAKALLTLLEGHQL